MPRIVLSGLANMVAADVSGNVAIQSYDDDLEHISGVTGQQLTVSVNELNYLDNDNLTADDITKLAELTSTATELNYINGIASGSAVTAAADDEVVIWDISAVSGGPGLVLRRATLASVCFLKGTKITLPDYSQKNIEDLTLADDVLTYNIDGISNIKDKNVLKNVQLDSMNGKISQSGIRNIWINPTDSYLIINDKLKVTKNHIIHFKRDNQHYFRFADHLTIGDELMNDKEVYESVEDIKEIHEKTNVYNFELDKDNTYFAENYLVHHYCELCSGYSKII